MKWLKFYYILGEFRGILIRTLSFFGKLSLVNVKSVELPEELPSMYWLNTFAYENKVCMRIKYSRDATWPFHELSVGIPGHFFNSEHPCSKKKTHNVLEICNQRYVKKYTPDFVEQEIPK